MNELYAKRLEMFIFIFIFIFTFSPSGYLSHRLSFNRSFPDKLTLLLPEEISLFFLTIRIGLGLGRLCALEFILGEGSLDLELYCYNTMALFLFYYLT